MTNINDLISKVKTEINSILVSAGAEITLRQLEVDYHDLVYKAIPYRETGHSSLEELVLSMPDAVMTRWWNGELKVCAVTNLHNEQVAKFVSLSKKKPRTSYRPNRRSLPAPLVQPLMSSTITRNNTVSVNVTNPPKAGSNNTVSLNATNHPKAGSNNMVSVNATDRPKAESNNTVFVNATNLPKAGSNADYSMLRGEILNLMLGYRYGLPGSKFAEAFAKRYGNYRKLSDSGFRTVLILLQSMPDVVDIEFNQSDEDYTVRGKRGRKNPNGYESNQVHHQRFPIKENGAENGSTEQKRDFNMTPEVPGSLAEYANGERNHLIEMPCGVEETFENAELDEKVPGYIKSNIQKVLSMHPNGLYASKFIAEYKRLHGTELVMKKLGYQNLIELVADLREIAVIERPDNGDWLVFDRRTYREGLINQVLQCKGKYLPPTPTLLNFRQSLQMILETNEGGVQLKDLEDIYENSIRQSMNPRQFGFQNLDRLLESVDDMAEIVYMGAGRVMVKLVKTQHNMCNGNQTIRNADLSLAPFLPTTQGHLPKDVAPDGHSYVKQDPPAPSEKYIGVEVLEVLDPSHFWFLLTDKKPELECLMDNLQEFYVHPSGKNYIIPDEMMKVGLVCVGQYPHNKEWHRCIILELKDESAKVSYVDYGTEGFVCKKSLRFITLSFLSVLPSQAIGGRLSRIAPVGKSWTQDAINCFFDHVVDRPLGLVARITNIWTEELFPVSLCLCDTSGREEIHINDYLIQEQHAKLSIEGRREAVADVEEDVGAVVDEWIVCNDEEDDDEYEFSSSESEMGQMVVSSQPAVATTSQPHPEKAEEAATVPGGHLFKFVQLTAEYSFHLINISDKAYIISSEVSSFFWEEDLIRPLLRNQGKTNVSKFVLTEDEHGEILQQLYDAQLPGTSRNGIPSQMVVLYELLSVVEILELFNHPSEELKLAVQQQSDLFNCQDSYWTGKKELEADRLSPDVEQDYVQTMNDLQKKRERALRQMQNTSSCDTARLVEELEDIEEKQETLRTHFEQLTDRESASVRSFGSSIVLPVDHVLQQDRLNLQQRRTELSSAPWSMSTSSNSLGNSSSRSLLSTTNEETSHIRVNNSNSFPATSLPVSSLGPPNLGVNSSSTSSVPDQTSLSLAVYSGRNFKSQSLNHDSAKVLPSNMALLSLGGIQTQATGFEAAVSSGTTSFSYSTGYQVPMNNGLPMILNNSFLPGFNPLQYNPVVLGSLPYPPAGPCYFPGTYHVNGVMTTPGLLPSLSIYTRLATGGFPNGLALPNTFFATNKNLPNVRR